MQPSDKEPCPGSIPESCGPRRSALLCWAYAKQTSNVQRPTSNIEFRKQSGKETLGRKHGLGFADARDAMRPTFVAAEDFNLHPQKINRHLQFRFGQMRHPH